MSTFNGLKKNAQGLVDLEFSNDFYREKDDSIHLNPEIFQDITKHVKIGTALQYDSEADVIDVGVKSPLVADAGRISLSLGHGLAVQDGKLVATGAGEGEGGGADLSEGEGITIVDGIVSVSAGASIDLRTGSVEVKTLPEPNTKGLTTGTDGVLGISLLTGRNMTPNTDIDGYSGLGFDTVRGGIGIRLKADSGLTTTSEGLAIKYGTGLKIVDGVLCVDVDALIKTAEV